VRAWLFLVLVGCHSVTGGGAGDDDASADASNGGGGVFAATSVIVEIDYETGQEPYTGPILGFGDTFDATVTNIDRLFAGKKMLTIPRAVGDMENVGAIADEELTIADLSAFAMQHRNEHDATGVKTFYVLFVSGHFTDANGPNAGVLGVSFGDTIAMFKDVIRSTDVLGVPNVVRYVEQSTLIHELGHSIGLVDNGVAMVAAHEDSAHGAHCSNPDCVMYWQNEGASDAAQFARDKLLTGSTVIFDAQCLADVDALTGGP
jgi:hypothetical protein